MKRSTMERNWRWWALVGLAVGAIGLGSGCEPGDLDGSPEGEAYGAGGGESGQEAWTTVSLAERGELQESFASGEVLIEPDVESFMHVGVLLDGELSGDLEYRVYQDGWSDFGEVEWTWVEDRYHVGRILLDEPAVALELRVDGATSAEALEYLALEFYEEAYRAEVLTRDLPVVGIEEDEEADVATVQQAVAPSSLVISRAAWGARYPNRVCGSTHSPREISIHHTYSPATDGANPAARMRSMQAFHMDNRGWCDIGYHFVVSQSGRVYQGRSTVRRTGAHVIGRNTNNVGVALIGNFQSQTPSNTQLNATADIVRWISQTFSVPLNRNRVKGHGEWPGQTTSCPGTNLRQRIPTILERASSGSSSSGSGSSGSGSSGVSGGTAPSWHLKNSLGGGAADLSFTYASRTDLPLVGDWNGDGKMTPGVVRGSTWYLRNAHAGGSADVTFQFGREGDIPVVGDWNGDGRMTPGIVRDGTWHLKNSLGGGAADVSFRYGRSDDAPVVGDWNGNGRMTPGVVRGSTWHLRNGLSGGAADVSFQYGTSGDHPLAGDWNGNGRMTPGIFRSQ